MRIAQAMPQKKSGNLSGLPDVPANNSLQEQRLTGKFAGFISLGSRAVYLRLRRPVV
jgi:hypothetical protein